MGGLIGYFVGEGRGGEKNEEGEEKLKRWTSRIDDLSTGAM